MYAFIGVRVDEKHHGRGPKNCIAGAYLHSVGEPPDHGDRCREIGLRYADHRVLIGGVVIGAVGTLIGAYGRVQTLPSSFQFLP